MIVSDVAWQNHVDFHLLVLNIEQILLYKYYVFFIDNGYKYYVFFIDNYSRFTYISL